MPIQLIPIDFAEISLLGMDSNSEAWLGPVITLGVHHDIRLSN